MFLISLVPSALGVMSLGWIDRCRGWFFPWLLVASAGAAAVLLAAMTPLVVAVVLPPQTHRVDLPGFQ